MNIQSIESTISILNRAKNFNVQAFQGKRVQEGCEEVFPVFPAVKTEEELHACGNTACIAGYIAISPEWKAWGDVTSCGFPTIKGSGEVDALMQYWDLNSIDVNAIVYGCGWNDFVKANNFTGMPELWSDLTKEQAVSLFTQLREKYETKKPTNAAHI
jgi:hypothetical protein